MNKKIKTVVAAALVCACVAGAKPSEASALSKVVVGSAVAAVSTVSLPVVICTAATYAAVASAAYDVYDTFIKKKD